MSAVGLRRGRAAVDHQPFLVDVGAAADAPILARDHRRARAHADRALGQAVAIADAGEGGLGGVDDAIADVGRRHRARMRKLRDAGHATLAQLDREATETALVVRHVGVEAVEHAAQRVGGGAGDRLVQAEVEVVGVVAEIDLDTAGGRVDVDGDLDRQVLKDVALVGGERGVGF